MTPVPAVSSPVVSGEAAQGQDHCPCLWLVSGWQHWPLIGPHTTCHNSHTWILVLVYRGQYGLIHDRVVKTYNWFQMNLYFTDYQDLSRVYYLLSSIHLNPSWYLTLSSIHPEFPYDGDNEIMRICRQQQGPVCSDHTWQSGSWHSPSSYPPSWSQGHWPRRLTGAGILWGSLNYL